ncbi:MAG: histidine phosphatase family protein [Clostridia bacterium]|nr:histidine phosphatase family protein [Clostridia bacterium]
MKIYFVRHGHPDYSRDCLTALGHRQAESAAKRLQPCGIERVFSSTMGRAWQTAVHTAELLGLEIAPCDFAREISWGTMDGEPLLDDGNPWLLMERTIAEGQSLCDPDWRSSEYYRNNKFLQTTSGVIAGLDAWLEKLGYKREGDYYRVMRENTDGAVALFSHGNASATMFSHLFNIPLPQVIGLLYIDFTCVTVIELPECYGSLVFPKLVSADAHHIAGLDVENVSGD